MRNYLVLAICIVCVGFIAQRWYRELTEYVPNPGQLPTQQSVDAALKDGASDTGRVRIPTGLFIQSVEFVTANDANITGYIWQKYGDDVPDSVSRGIVFPEQVNSDETVVEEAYRRRNGSEETIGWYFDVTVREPFDYTKYPLDTQDVWLRIWPKDFDRDVVLVPDLAAYDATGIHDIFGIDSDIVPGGWRIEDTFFSYAPGNYDTNFGIASYAGQHGFPELHFTITLRRSFVNVFVVALVPLLVVLILLHSVLIMATRDKDKAEALGFNATGAIGAATALLFVVILAHIDLRRQFESVGLVYLEYFYLIAYVAVLGVSLDVYLFSAARGGRFIDFLRRDDNRFPKLAFWPCVLIFLAIVTAVVFRR